MDYILPPVARLREYDVERVDLAHSLTNKGQHFWWSSLHHSKLHQDGKYEYWSQQLAVHRGTEGTRTSTLPFDRLKGIVPNSGSDYLVLVQATWLNRLPRPQWTDHPLISRCEFTVHLSYGTIIAITITLVDQISSVLSRRLESCQSEGIPNPGTQCLNIIAFIRRRH